MRISWHDFYNAALQESDWTKVEERIQTAESEIHKRWIALSQGADGTLVEVDALASALNRLKVVRTDIAACANGRLLNKIQPNYSS